MSNKKEKMVSQLRNDLNGVASKIIEPHEAHGIVSSLWVSSGFNKELCMAAILSLGGKHPSEKIKDFRRYGLAFLDKLANTTKSNSARKEVEGSEYDGTSNDTTEDEPQETPKSVAKLNEEAFLLLTTLNKRDPNDAAYELISVLYDSIGRDEAHLQNVIREVQDPNAKKYFLAAATAICRPHQSNKPDSSVFLILIIIFLLIIIALMLAR